MNLPRLILASASPRRAELLRKLGLKFRVVPSNAPEVHHEQLTARELSQLNAYRKARAVAKKIPDALVLARRFLPKPRTSHFTRWTGSKSGIISRRFIRSIRRAPTPSR